MLKVGIISLCLYLAIVGGLTEGRVYDTGDLSLPARLMEYIGEHPEILKQLLPPGTSLSPQPMAEGDTLCTGCLTAFSFLKSLILIGVKWPSIRDDVVVFCETIVNGNGWHGDIMCPGLVDSTGPFMYDAVKGSRKSAKKICIHMNWCDPYEAPSFSSKRQKRDISKAYIDKLQHVLKHMNLDNFKIRTNGISDKAKVLTPDTEIKNTVNEASAVPHHLQIDDDTVITKTHTARIANRQFSQSTDNYMKVLQLADIHVEVDYLTGAATDCGLPVCCRPDFEGSGEAGAWGEWNCDSSPDTISKLMRSAASHNPDFIIYAGDNPPTNTLWMETLEGQLNTSRWVARELAAEFPNITVYPNIGNFDSHPVNMYYVPREETKALNREWGNMFKGIANFGEDQLETINKAGYYTTLVKPGLRIMSYNSNYGGVLNFMNLLNYNRPEYKEMLQWMDQTLAQARNASEHVFLMCHHPYGSLDMVVTFDQDILAILVKYSDVIMWHPVGHVHMDEFRINFDPATGLPVGVVFEVMSMTSFSYVNPGYRVWYFDPETYQPIDYEQYTIDIKKANDNPEDADNIHLAYRASDEYGLNDLSPSSMLELYNRIMTNDTLLQRYWSLRRGGTGAGGPCDDKCKLAQECHIISPTFDVYRACMRNQPKINETLYGSHANTKERYAALWDHPEGKIAAFGSSVAAAIHVTGATGIYLVALTLAYKSIWV